jgi:hypothetical protein
MADCLPSGQKARHANRTWIFLILVLEQPTSDRVQSGSPNPIPATLAVVWRADLFSRKILCSFMTRLLAPGQQKAGKPFFCWWNGTRMHFRTHVKDEHTGLSGPSGDEYQDGMVEHDMHVGELLKLLDDLGIAEDTIVFYSTDNGPHYNTWPDAGTHPLPQREKLELGGRLPGSRLRPLAWQVSGRPE